MDACPIGYHPIKDPTECKAAAGRFGYDWREAEMKDMNSVCFYCTGCVPNEVHLSSTHGKGAFWICIKGE